jgi:hypothetical protein
VVLLDFAMPAPSGIELAQQARGSGFNQRTPIIMISDDQRPSAVSEGFDAGASFFLYKPIDMTRLQRLIRVTQGAVEQEKRRFRRVPVRSKVRLSSDQGELDCETIDLSLNGMMVHSPRTVPAGSRVRLTLTYPTAPNLFSARGCDENRRRASNGDSIQSPTLERKTAKFSFPHHRRLVMLFSCRFPSWPEHLGESARAWMYYDVHELSRASHSYDIRLSATCLSPFLRLMRRSILPGALPPREEVALCMACLWRFAMGGIWAMHYIGCWPTSRRSHSLRLSDGSFSLLAAVFGSAIALWIVSRKELTVISVIWQPGYGSTIAVMHYVRMAAMRMPAMCHYNLTVVGASILIAVVVCRSAPSTFRFRVITRRIPPRKAFSAVVMGFC